MAVHLNTRAEEADLIAVGYDEIILATGVSPRSLDVEGIDHPKVMDYTDVLYHKKPVGERVAIIGAGGIGFDMAEYLAHDMAHESVSMSTENYMKEWGVDMSYAKGGALADAPQPLASPREIYLLKRSKGKHGKNLGKTTGWIHRSSLSMKDVNMLAEVSYEKIDDQGLHIRVGEEPQLLAVDHVVVCAGQVSLKELEEGLKSAGQNVHLIGGANIAAQLDAKMAIKEASELAAKL